MHKDFFHARQNNSKQSGTGCPKSSLIGVTHNFWDFFFIGASTQQKVRKSQEVKFRIETIGFVMTNAVTNRGICFIRSVLLWWEHGHFSQNLRRIAQLAPPPQYD